MSWINEPPIVEEDTQPRAVPPFLSKRGEWRKQAEVAEAHIAEMLSAYERDLMRMDGVFELPPAPPALTRRTWLRKLADGLECAARAFLFEMRAN